MISQGLFHMHNRWFSNIKVVVIMPVLIYLSHGGCTMPIILNYLHMLLKEEHQVIHMCDAALYNILKYSPLDKCIEEDLDQLQQPMKGTVIVTTP